MSPSFGILGGCGALGSFWGEVFEDKFHKYNLMSNYGGGSIMISDQLVAGKKYNPRAKSASFFLHIKKPIKSGDCMPGLFLVFGGCDDRPGQVTC